MTYQEYRDVLQGRPQEARHALWSLICKLDDHDARLILGACWALLNGKGSNTPAEDFVESILMAYFIHGRHLHPNCAAQRLEQFQEAYDLCLQAAEWFHELVDAKGKAMPEPAA